MNEKKNEQTFFLLKSDETRFRDELLNEMFMYCIFWESNDEVN